MRLSDCFKERGDLMFHFREFLSITSQCGQIQKSEWSIRRFARPKTENTALEDCFHCPEKRHDIGALGYHSDSSVGAAAKAGFGGFLK